MKNFSEVLTVDEQAVIYARELIEEYKNDPEVNNTEFYKNIVAQYGR